MCVTLVIASLFAPQDHPMILRHVLDLDTTAYTMQYVPLATGIPKNSKLLGIQTSSDGLLSHCDLRIALR